jgi:hypothetical protein
LVEPERTWTDAILKKFDRKMNFKLKINVQRYRTNFRSIQLDHLQPSEISRDYLFNICEGGGPFRFNAQGGRYIRIGAAKAVLTAQHAGTSRSPV